MTNTPALMPCPFCGGAKVLMCPPTCDERTPYNAADRAFPVVKCYGCWAQVAGKDWDQSGESAIAAWNTRALASSWQPIETAPREERILLWDGKWASPGGYCEYDSIGWLMDCYDLKYDPAPTPTHWQPLPPPPKASP